MRVRVCAYARVACYLPRVCIHRSAYVPPGRHEREALAMNPYLRVALRCGIGTYSAPPAVVRPCGLCPSLTGTEAATWAC